MNQRVRPWETVVQAGVRLGGPAGALCAFVWEERGRYHFSYLPSYNASPASLCLDPFYLPQDWGVRSSTGLKFDGPLSVFSMMEPGPFSEHSCFRWFHEAMALVTGMSGPIQVPRTLSPLARLVWASHCFTYKTGTFGLFFDPAARWPDSTERLWMPDRPEKDDATGCWAAFQKAMRTAPPRPQTNWVPALQRLHADQVNYDSIMARSIVPFPGTGIRVRFDLDKVAGFIRMEVPARGQQVKGARKLRLRAAYLDLAGRCGLRTVRHQLLPLDGNNDVHWVEKHVGGPLVPVASLPASSIPTDEGAADDWLVESTGKGIYLGHPPVAALIGFAAAVEKRGERFDRKEAFARICFSTITGLFWNDTTPIITRPSADASWGFWKEGAEWKLAPLTSLKPALLPYKTALTMQSRLTRQAMRYAKILNLSSGEAMEVLIRISNGLRQWDELRETYGLNDFEMEGARPAVLVVPPAAQVDGKPRRGRRPGALAAIRPHTSCQ